MPEAAKKSQIFFDILLENMFNIKELPESYILLVNICFYV